MKNIFSGIIRFSIYALVFLTPIFFLPFSFEQFEFNKQYLILFLTSLCIFAWFAKMVLVDKEIRFRRTPLDLPILAFLGVAVLSAVFSVDKISSLFGFYGRFSGGLIGLLSCGAMYFLITNNVSVNREQGTENKEQRTKNKTVHCSLFTVHSLLKVFLWSVGVVVAMSYLTIFGLWQKLSLITDNLSLPRVMLQNVFNPVAGSMEGLSIFLAVVVVFLTGMILTANKEQRIENKEQRIKDNRLMFAAHCSLLFAATLLLVVIDFAAAWVILAVSLLLFTGLALWKRMFKENVNKLLLPIFLIIIAAVFAFANTAELTRNLNAKQALNMPKEQVLEQATSWKVARGAAFENVKSAFLGSGIATFHYDFAKFKPIEFNEHILWQLRFDRAGSHIAEIFGTMGILGLLTWFFLIGFIVKSFLIMGDRGGVKEDKGNLRNIKGKRKSLITDNLSLPLLMVFGALVVSQFVYYQNTVLLFLFWLVLGLSAVAWKEKSLITDDLSLEKVFSFKEIPEMALVLNVVLILVGLGLVGGYYQFVKFYKAETIYAKSVQLSVSPDERIVELEKAVRYNPFQVQYKIVLARSYFNRILSEFAKPLDQRNQNVISQSAYSAIAHIKGESLLTDFTDREAGGLIKGAADIAPNQVAVWETMGIIYRDIQGVAQGANKWAIESFEKALVLEPTNPVLRAELGKLYMLGEESEKARIEFEKAVELKPNYIDANLQIVFMIEREEDLQGAITKMERLANSYPLNFEVLFQLGRLYFNNERTDEAIIQFQRVVSILPAHSNALYSLGVAYESKGEKETALQYFRRVLELNPDNADVLARVEELD